MKKHSEFQLGDVATFIRGINFKPADVVKLTVPNAVACMRTKNVQNELDLSDVWAVDRKFVKRDEQFLRDGDILVSSANSWNLVGKCCYIDNIPYISSFGGFVSVIRPNPEKIIPRFLYHWFASDIIQTKIRSFGRQTTNISNLDLTRCLELPLSLPSDAEQRHIADILDKTDAIRRKRQQSLKLANDLVKSRFVEMFGDPVENPFEWSTKSLLDMGYCKNGMNFHTGDSGIEIRCLGVGDFKDYSIIDGTDNLPTISLNKIPPHESMLQDGDILFVRSNGNKAFVGRCLVVYPRNTPTTYSGFCIRYRLTGGEVNITYLLSVLKTDSMRMKMSGRGANIQNLNQQMLATLDIPTPPISLQDKFATFVQQVDKSKFALQDQLQEIEMLSSALKQEFFS